VRELSANPSCKNDFGKTWFLVYEESGERHRGLATGSCYFFIFATVEDVSFAEIMWKKEFFKGTIK